VLGSIRYGTCNTMIIRELEVTLASPPFFPLEEVKLSRIDAVKEPCYVST
jgi:hypothetical protein